jgi:hypothetical protein
MATSDAAAIRGWMVAAATPKITNKTAIPAGELAELPGIMMDAVLFYTGVMVTMEGESRAG